MEGLLYIGYPIIGTSEGPFSIDALFLSPAKGLVVFSLVEGKELNNYEDSQDDSFNKLQSKLLSHRALLSRRKLVVPIATVTFAPVVSKALHKNVEYPICNESNLRKWINSLKEWEGENFYKTLVATLQSISTLRKSKLKREVNIHNSRGARLKQIEASIANLDQNQSKAVIETVEGVQRIRGLAGSGKTIVLALKAAYLHSQHPEWKIAVTFNTRSLKGQFQRLINGFMIEQSGEELDPENLHILNAWGAPGGRDRQGLYYRYCVEAGVEYFDFSKARSYFGSGKEFESVCNMALQKGKTGEVNFYDLILVDEAQDFPPSFLRLCYELLGPEKRLVYAYDELQNLSARSMPSPEEIFGKRQDGRPNVTLMENHTGKPQQDIILSKCYRNARPVLITAHALGFGIYRVPPPGRETGLVQMFEQTELWTEIGYEVSHGRLKDGEDVELSRNSDSSPEFLEKHSHVDDLVQFHLFSSSEEQTAWVAEAVHENLKKEELRTDDIVIINPDPRTTRDVAGPIRERLLKRGINSHLAGIDTSPDVFFNEELDSVVFTGIYRAKGNEAGMVYVVNAQDCYSSSQNLASVRNQLFAAITRSKAWVRILGVGEDMRNLIKEYEQVKANNFKLQFVYPTEKQRQHMNIVNRDMTAAERKKVQKKKSQFDDLVDALAKGEVFPEDLDPEQVNRLTEILSKAKR